jgi:hypothetical protein
MKTRNGFVSNSSTSVYICECCGIASAFPDDYDESDEYKYCKNEHLICINCIENKGNPRHKVILYDNLTLEDYKINKIIKLIEEYNLEYIMDINIVISQLEEDRKIELIEILKNHKSIDELRPVLKYCIKFEDYADESLLRKVCNFGNIKKKYYCPICFNICIPNDNLLEFAIKKLGITKEYLETEYRNNNHSNFGAS